MGENFFRARGMPGALPVHAVENIGHTSKQYTEELNGRSILESYGRRRAAHRGKPATSHARYDLNLHQAWRRNFIFIFIFLLRQQIHRRNAGTSKGFLTVLGGGSAHVSLHECQPWASATSHAMGALRTTREIAQADGTNFFQLRRVTPDVDEALLPHITARQGKLHARVKFSVGRNVATRVTCAAR